MIIQDDLYQEHGLNYQFRKLPRHGTLLVCHRSDELTTVGHSDEPALISGNLL
ncbi:hypothetical protein [Pseudomonas glycinae]|uniref:hypothetical protein n=1 Tax=Pseudomonas glycinae TaxID=1785145 RepID=UPI00167E6F39|nr:hypothetical protein [Pseudomonas glycinae]